jgi:hypothetical protein
MPKKRAVTEHNLMEKYLGEVISFGGVWMPRGEVIATMQREGQDPRCIDRWLQGQEFMAELTRQESEKDLSLPENQRGA